MDPTHAVGAAWAPPQPEVPVKGPLLDYAEVVSEAVAVGTRQILPATSSTPDTRFEA